MVSTEKIMTSPALSPLIVERLAERLSWYGKRFSDQGWSGIEYFDDRKLMARNGKLTFAGERVVIEKFEFHICWLNGYWKVMWEPIRNAKGKTLSEAIHAAINKVLSDE